MSFIGYNDFFTLAVAGYHREVQDLKDLRDNITIVSIVDVFPRETVIIMGTDQADLKDFALQFVKTWKEKSISRDVSDAEWQSEVQSVKETFDRTTNLSFAWAESADGLVQMFEESTRVVPELKMKRMNLEYAG